MISIVNADQQILSGVHYKKLPDKIHKNATVKQFIKKNSGKVQVVMFFNYACGVCNRLNKPFDAWEKKQNHNKISPYKIPVSFNRGWGSLAQAFYAMRTFDNPSKLDDIIFYSIHTKAMPLWNEKTLEDVLADNGIDRNAFKQAFNSFQVKSQTKWADALSIGFEISAIPNIVVNGPCDCYVTNLAMTREIDFLFKVIDYLVKKELKLN